MRFIPLWARVVPILLTLFLAAGAEARAQCTGQRQGLSCTNSAPALFAPAAGEDYFDYDALLVRLLEIEAAYPDLVTASDGQGNNLSMGTSHRGRLIPYVMLTAADPLNVRGRAFVNGALHAREPNSMMQALYVLTDLAQRYGTDPAVTHLLDTREIVVAPLLNPDGWVRNTEGAIGWRKNDPIDEPSVDLNRNFGFAWDVCNDPGCNPQFPVEICLTYPGSGPFDQPETRAYRDFVNPANFDVVLNMHSFGRIAVEPDGCAAAPLSDPAVVAVTSTFHRFSGYQDDVLTALLGQTAGGGANSWAYRVPSQPVAFAPEIGAPVTTPRLGQFQSAGCVTESFYPSLAEMRSTGAALRAAFVETLLSAGPSVELETLRWVPVGPGADPGETVELEVGWFSRGTFPLASGLTSLRSDSPHADVIAGAAGVATAGMGIGDRIALDSSELALRLHDDTPAGAVIDMTVIFDDGFERREFPLSFRAGTPRVWLDSTAENGSAGWTFSGGFGIQTAGDAFEGGAYFADSPYATYAGSALSRMVSDSLDLSGWDNLHLEHAVRWDVYYRTDAATVSTSTDGQASWNNVATPYGHLGYGNGRQRACKYGYTGRSRSGAQQARWLRESVDLSSAAGAADFRLRYEMSAMPTSHSELGKGLDIDAIRLVSYPDATRQITWAGRVDLDRDVHIAAGQTLVVTAGADVVIADSDAANVGSDPNRIEILVDGTLLVEGQDGNPASLRGASTAADGWSGLLLRAGASGTVERLYIDGSARGLVIEASADATLIGIDADHASISGTATLPFADEWSRGDLNVDSGGRLTMEADLTVGAAARFWVRAGAEVLAGDIDASGGGADPGEVELIVDGHLLLTGATGVPARLAAATPGSDWAGIRWQSVYPAPTTSALIDAEISDALVGMEMSGGALMVISRTRFDGNETGLRIVGRQNDPLYDTEFIGGQVGLDLTASGPTVQGGLFNGQLHGVRCAGSSRPRIRRADFNGQTVAVAAMDGTSRPDLGVGSDPGLNNFDPSNQYNLALVDPLQDVHAENNWWGSVKTGTIESKFLIATSDPQYAGGVLYIPFLTSARP